MRGLRVSGGKLEILYDTRTVATTDGTLVCLLPTPLETTETISFPHPASNDHCYAWGGSNVDTGTQFHQTQTAQIYFSSLAEEVESEVVVSSVPDGADFFIGLIKLNRTVDPTHSWCGQSLTPLQKEGEWLPWYGSGMVEAALGLTRLLHLYIDGTDLKLVAQQSVGPASGGQDHSYGDYPSLWGASVGSRSGGLFQSLTTPGLIRWTSTSSPYRKTASQDVPDTDYRAFDSLMRGKSDQCDTTDPTNYLSTYSVDIRGHFGRRS